MKKYLYPVVIKKIPAYLKYWLMYSSKKISLLIQSLPITLENTIKNLKIIINKIYGNTEQETRSGKNLFNNDIGVKLNYSATGTKIDTGMKATQTTAGTYKYFTMILPNSQNLTSKRLTLSAVITPSSNNVGRIGVFRILKSTGLQDGEAIATLNQTGNVQVTMPSTLSDSYDFGLLFYANTNGTGNINDYVDYTNVQLEESSSPTSYEPYGASPSPEFPSEIKNVTGDIEIKVQNKNRLPFTNQDFTVNNVRYYVQDGSLYLNGNSTGETSSKNINFKNNFNFTLPAGTWKISHKTGVVASYLYDYNNDTSYILVLGQDEEDDTFTLEEETKLYFGFYVYQKSFNNVNAELQLEINSVSPYIPHQEQNFRISLGDIELCKIGMAQDYIYKQNGNWYKYGAIGKVVLDGSENWIFNNSSTSPTSRSIMSHYSSITLKNTDYLSNYFIKNSISSNRFVILLPNGLYISLDDNITGIISTDTDAEKLTKLKSWLSTHNTTVYYVLATPTDTQITDETLLSQLAELEQLRSYDNVTNIDANQDIKIDLDYYVRG